MGKEKDREIVEDGKGYDRGWAGDHHAQSPRLPHSIRSRLAGDLLIGPMEAVALYRPVKDPTVRAVLSAPPQNNKGLPNIERPPK